ncbi:MAG: formate dehydrogenase accessory sulfurtransferase FdhD [Parasporobacterium sp.]|nr:formate dehydrogenase accessory sulfurtransferase FdhD [Parasporobacterium sp.]
MKIANHFNNKDVAQTIGTAKYYPDGNVSQETEVVSVEHTIRIIVDGDVVISVTCTPSDLAEMVLGRLCGEGIICDVSQVEGITINDDGSRATVVTRNSDSTGRSHDALPEHNFTASDIFAAINAFHSNSAFHKETPAAHCCMLAGPGGQVHCVKEDIRRHTALDKTIGAGLLMGLHFSETAAFISGRVPADMIIKVIRAGIPVLISKSVPTAETVKLAEKYGLTLITSAWPDSFTLCTGYIN